MGRSNRLLAFAVALAATLAASASSISVPAAFADATSVPGVSGEGGATGGAWPETRRVVIDPIDAAIHGRLPASIASRDLEKILSAYATESEGGIGWESAERSTGAEEIVRWRTAAGPESLRARYQRLLDLFPAIDDAEVRIEKVAWNAKDAEGYPAEIRLIVRAARGDGAAAVLDQRMRIHLALRGGDWRITQQEVTARELVARAKPAFELATESARVADVHTNQGSPLYRTAGGTKSSAGSAVADVDRDGCEDVFLPGQPDAKLLRNACDGTFSDATATWGLPHPYPAVATGAVFFDYDNDGRPDLFVAAAQGGDRLFHNVKTESGTTLVDVTKQAGIPEGAWSVAAVVADFDRDGFLDLYVVRTGDQGDTVPSPALDPENGLGGILLRNRGDGTFQDVTKAAGLASRGWAAAAAWGDYDNDGHPDLFVANEYGRSVLYRNRGNGTFEDASEKSGVRLRGGALGAAWGDYDGDGQLDLFVSGAHAAARWALSHPDLVAPASGWGRLFGRSAKQAKQQTDDLLESWTRGSSLFLNDGHGKLTDVADAAGVRDTGWSSAAEFLDYDNDGRLDLVVQNGFVTGAAPEDAARGLFEGMVLGPDPASDSLVNVGGKSLAGRERKVLLRNEGDGTFVDVAYPNGIARIEDGRGLSLFDYDGDGRTDILFRNYRQPTQLLHNVGARGDWMDIRLVGTISNRDAVGAKIRLGNREGWQTRVVSEGSGALSGQSLIQHFGLGADDRAREIVIWWPSGATTRFADLEGGHRFTITENSMSPITCADPACEQ